MPFSGLFSLQHIKHISVSTLARKKTISSDSFLSHILPYYKYSCTEIHNLIEERESISLWRSWNSNNPFLPPERTFSCSRTSKIKQSSPYQILKMGKSYWTTNYIVELFAESNSKTCKKGIIYHLEFYRARFLKKAKFSFSVWHYQSLKSLSVHLGSLQKCLSSVRFFSWIHFSSARFSSIQFDSGVSSISWIVLNPLGKSKNMILTALPALFIWQWVCWSRNTAS